MNLDTLFKTYYALYRTEAQTPNSSDDEYVIFTLLTTEAIDRWSNYDNTFWKELYSTNQTDGSGDTVIAANTQEYECPSNMKQAGGFLRIYDNNGVTQRRLPIIEPQEAQFQSDTAQYAWFEGDPNNGFTLHLNPAPDNVIVGMNFDYVYYKNPDTLASGTDVPQMSQPFFIVHRCLANRFRGSRNPYYTAAKNDAEDVLKSMKMKNDSGDWSNPWSLVDHSGGVFGTANGNNQGVL